MAFTLEQLKKQILTSLHGRRFGIDGNSFLVGPKGLRTQVTDATSDTTGTGLPNNGLASLVTSTNDTWTLDAPTPGCEVKLVTGSSSTGNHIVTMTGATAVTTNGIASNTITMQGGGAFINLTGISTSGWAITSKLDSSGASTVNLSS